MIKLNVYTVVTRFYNKSGLLAGESVKMHSIKSAHAWAHDASLSRNVYDVNIINSDGEVIALYHRGRCIA